MAEGDVYQIDIRGNADQLRDAARQSVKELNSIGDAAKRQQAMQERIDRINKSSARWAREQRLEAYRQLSVEEKITRLKERQALVNARLARSQGNAYRMAALGARSNQIGAELTALQAAGGGAGRAVVHDAMQEKIDRINKSSARYAREQRLEAFRQLTVEEKITRLKERQAVINARLVRSQGNAFRMAALGARSNQIGAELTALQAAGGVVRRAPGYFGEGGIARLALRGAGFAGAERLGALGRMGSLLPPWLMAGLVGTGAFAVNLFGQSNRALEIQKSSKRAGIGVENYQALSFATSQTGVDMGELLRDWKNSGQGLQEFLKTTKPAIAEMTEQFKAMGLALSPDKIEALARFRVEIDGVLAKIKAKFNVEAGNAAYGMSKVYYAGKIISGASQLGMDALTDGIADVKDWALDGTVGKLFPGLQKYYKSGKRNAQETMLGLEGDARSLFDQTDPAEANRIRLQNLLEKKREEKKAYEKALKDLAEKERKEYKEDPDLWRREKERLGYAGSSSGHGEWARNGWFASSAQASQAIESLKLQRRMVSALEEIRSKMRANAANVNQYFG